MLDSYVNTHYGRPMIKKMATIRIPEIQAKRLAKIVDRRRDPLAPTITQILLRGLELSLKEVERK